MIAKCDLCPFTTRFNSKLKLHRLAVHSELKPWPCTFPGCNYRAGQKVHLKQHSLSHEATLELRKPFLCTFEGCDYRATAKFTVTEHVNRKHTPNRTWDFQCVLCSSRFFSQTGLTAHIRNHVKEKGHKCNICDYTTHHRSYLPSHVRDVHQRLRTFTCTHPGCNFSTYYKSGFTQHSKRHDPNLLVRLPAACSYPDCDYRARDGSRLREHTFRCHNPSRTKGFPCNFCAKAFYEESSLTNHINRAHLNEKAHKCEQCDYATASLAALKWHEQKKHGNRERAKVKGFVCGSCDFRAVHYSELDYHTRAVHKKEWRFRCEKPGCNYGTYHANPFKNHLLAHEEDPKKHFPLACAFPGCDFRRMTRPEMKAHERNHQVSTLKLKCRSCGRGNYPDTQSLNFHNRINHVKMVYKDQPTFAPIPVVILERIIVQIG